MDSCKYRSPWFSTIVGLSPFQVHATISQDAYLIGKNIVGLKISRLNF